jgi:Tfp pilus assembly protein PilF
MSVRENLERLIASGEDNAALRFALGNAYLGQAPATAAAHFEAALRHDPDYSAAWKQLGKARAAAGDAPGAAEAWRQGVSVAARKGDKQAEREMSVFLKRATAAGDRSRF